MRGVLDAQPAPPGWVLLVTAALALAAVAHPGGWRILRHVVTIAHEGGHALVAVATGRRLRGVRLHSDTSGLTLSAGRPHGPGMVATAFAGYVAPSLLGVGGAWLLGAGRITLTLWVAVALLGLLLVNIRNLFGVLSVVVTGGLLLGVSRLGDALAQACAAHALVWLLLLAGPRPVLELQRSRRRGRAPTSDADQLARLTRLPGLVWVGVFLLVTLGCCGLGAALLVGGAR